MLQGVSSAVALGTARREAAALIQDSQLHKDLKLGVRKLSKEHDVQLRQVLHELREELYNLVFSCQAGASDDCQ